jgi:hypothetical protein
MAHWTGASWTPVSGRTDKLAGVFGNSTNDFWSVGYSHGAAEIIQYSGSAWSTPTPGGSLAATVNAFWGSTSNDLWATATTSSTTGEILHFDGSAWSVSKTLTFAPTAIWGASATDIWVVGRGGAIMNWNGCAWAPASSMTTNDLASVYGSQSRDVWAVGGSGTIDHWGGAGWSVTTNGTANLASVWADATTGEAWAVGQSNTALHWTGSAWTTPSPPAGGWPVGLVGFGAVWGSSANNVLITASGPLTTWNGVQFSVAATGLPNAFWNQISGTSPQDVWMMGFEIVGAGSVPITAHLGSSAWSVSNTQLMLPLSVWAAPGLGAFAGGDGIVHHP